MVLVVRKTGILFIGRWVPSSLKKPTMAEVATHLLEYSAKCLGIGLLAGVGTGLLIAGLHCIYTRTRPSGKTLFRLFRITMLLVFGALISYQATLLDWDTLFPLVSDKLMDAIGIPLPMEE